MTFKEELQAKLLEDERVFAEERLSSLEDTINRKGGVRYLFIPLRPGKDFVCVGWLKKEVKMLPTGQAILDKLVSLGFEPIYRFGYKWLEDGFIIEW